jgi:hypothetical protein
VVKWVFQDPVECLAVEDNDRKRPQVELFALPFVVSTALSLVEKLIQALEVDQPLEAPPLHWKQVEVDVKRDESLFPRVAQDVLEPKAQLLLHR